MLYIITYIRTIDTTIHVGNASFTHQDHLGFCHELHGLKNVVIGIRIKKYKKPLSVQQLVALCYQFATCKTNFIIYVFS